MPFTVFKTQAGAGFRRYIVFNTRIRKIHDLVTLYPFEGAVNRTSAIIVEKTIPDPDEIRELKIEHIVWINRLGKSKPIPTDASLGEALKVTDRIGMIMAPIKRAVDTPWMQVTPKARTALTKVLSTNAAQMYQAHAGATTNLNQVYFIQILGIDKDGYLVITNPPEQGDKRRVRQIIAKVEPDLVYPLIRGRDINRWYIDYKDRYILVPHDPKSGKPLSINDLRMKFPRTYEYLCEFKNELIKRSIKPFLKLKKMAHKGDKRALKLLEEKFFMVDNVGPYTFAPYKVVWKRLAGAIRGKAVEYACSVVEPMKIAGVIKPVVPDGGTTIMIPLDNAEEAYYLAGILNSSITRTLIASYTYELRQETHILRNIHVPKYRSIEIQRRIAELSKKSHDLAREIYGKGKRDLESVLMKVEEELDRAVAELYGITEDELREIIKVYNILKGELFEASTNHQS